MSQKDSYYENCTFSKEVQNLKETLEKIEELPESVKNGLTGKRKEIFEAIQEGRVNA